VLYAEGITADPDLSARVAADTAVADARLADTSEAQLPPIQAWRRAFARMGLKPTQHRCAAESLLRRHRKHGELPRLHPLVDLANAVSVAFAIPVAGPDVARIVDHVEVRPADAARHAHALRWTHRQSAHSAVRDDTSAVLIVAEAMHDSAAADVAQLIETLAAEVAFVWSVEPTAAVLDHPASGFDFDFDFDFAPAVAYKAAHASS